MLDFPKRSERPAARGFLIGVPISLALWALIFAAVRYVWL